MPENKFTIRPSLAQRRRATAAHDPRPCPKCYAPMRPVDGVWMCARHGAPAP